VNACSRDQLKRGLTFADRQHSEMNVYEIDPTTDERWEDFLQNHAQASIFHTRGWLEALRRTYGYAPVAFTTSPPGSPLTNGIPFCKINGFFGKRRLVSLPFTDHCEPLVQTSEQLKYLVAYLQHKRDLEGWNYVEMRPLNSVLPTGTEFGNSQAFFFHRLDLRRSLDDILQNVHKDCVRRKIRRAEREGLVYQEGRSEPLLSKFYQLLLVTRRRHGLPVQPVSWFRNLIACLGANLTIRVASKDRRPIASILTLRYKQVIVYKYGCSDHTFNNLGGMQCLFWRAIQEAMRDQLWEFDLGRSDSDNPGLAVSKDRWGAAQTELVYFRYGAKYSRRLARAHQIPLSKYIWSHAPNAMLSAAGSILYRHLG
jgi:lipid II:glycine glycyltransferase (peptidoglycan interpeptide bridge formation enzyme)